LAVAGTTAGVLGADGSTLPVLDHAAIEELVSSRTATAGMIAKLRACEEAIAGGVGDVVIFDGRDELAIEEAVGDGVPARATRMAGLKTCTPGAGM
jgi:acetylglutamate kinase